MTDEELLRARLKSAIGYVPPSPGFGERPISEVATDRRLTGSRVEPRTTGLLALVAALLAVAIVVTLLAGYRALHVTAPLPARPGPLLPLVLKTTAHCTGGPRTEPVRMFSAADGWANGPYRTIDGGKDWTYVELPNIPRRVADSGVSELFLDSAHAWVVEAGGSAQESADHVVVFSTTDGGQSWRQSSAMAVKPARPTDSIWTYICFIDQQHGFLALASGQASMVGGVATTVSALYRTTDGGLQWTWVSDPVRAAGQQSCWFDGGMAFSSLTDGWIGGCGDNGPIATRDGGVTWSSQPGPPVAYFFDSRRGVMQEGSRVETTSDGGVTWFVDGPAPSNCSVLAFADLMHGWCLVNTGSVDPVAGTPIYPEVFRTVDGARTWSQPIKFQTYMSSATLDVVDAQTAFLAGGADFSIGDVPPGPWPWPVFRTTDGGANWTSVGVRPI